MKKKTIEIYRDSHLPSKGWIQSCFNCYTLTSKTFLYKCIKLNEKVYEFHIYNCNECKNKMKKNMLLFLNFRSNCDKYIKYNYNI